MRLWPRGEVNHSGSPGTRKSNAPIDTVEMPDVSGGFYKGAVSVKKVDADTKKLDTDIKFNMGPNGQHYKTGSVHS